MVCSNEEGKYRAKGTWEIIHRIHFEFYLRIGCKREFSWILAYVRVWTVKGVRTTLRYTGDFELDSSSDQQMISTWLRGYLLDGLLFAIMDYAVARWQSLDPAVNDFADDSKVTQACLADTLCVVAIYPERFFALSMLVGQYQWFTLVIPSQVLHQFWSHKSKYKRELCQYSLSAGRCSYGVRCASLPLRIHPCAKSR